MDQASPLAQRLRCATSLWLWAFCWVLFLVVTPVRAQAPTAALPKLTLNIGIHLIAAELAADEATRARGLMFRQQLAASEGMLFVFAQPAPQCFWMRNTLIPLSIAFLADDGTILTLADMQPQDDTTHCSGQPVRYALEVNQGWFAQRGIKTGAVVAGLDKLAALQARPPAR